MICLLGPFDVEMLERGLDTDKYFTKEYDLYHIIQVCILYIYHSDVISKRKLQKYTNIIHLVLTFLENLTDSNSSNFFNLFSALCDIGDKSSGIHNSSGVDS